MKIGIVGFGVVGKAAYSTFSDKYEVVKYDKFFKYDKFPINHTKGSKIK